MNEKEIALQPFHIVETTKFTVESDHELTETLRRYQAYYRSAYGANVTEAELLREMARQFMTSDKDFQKSGQKRHRTPRRKLPVSPLSTDSGNQLAFDSPKA